jgi:tetratricopeptide (TPR) repeat protein
MRLPMLLPGLARLAAAGALIAVVGVAEAPAGQPRLAQAAPDAPARAQRLDELFARLKATRDEGEGDTIVADIWKAWLQSGRPELDEQMDQAVKQMAFGLLQPALGILDAIVEQAPGWAEAWNKRATVLFLLDLHDRSLADIERTLALEPRHFGALAGRGLILTAKEDYRAALAAFRQALAINPFLKERHSIIPELQKRVGEKPT